MIHKINIFVRRTVEKRSAGDDPCSQRATSLENSGNRFLLNQHCTDHYIISPFQIGIFELLDVQIHQPSLPVVRKHGRDCEKPQGGIGGFFGDELEGVVKAPKGNRVFRVYQENLHHTIPYKRGIRDRTTLELGIR